MKDKYTVKCLECNNEYCWSCMTNMESHDAWYVYCPELNNSMCCNIAIAVTSIILMPFIMCLAPIAYLTVQFGLCWAWSACFGCCGDKVPCCIRGFFALIGTILLFPLLLLFGLVASVLSVCFGTVPMQFITLLYSARICKYTCLICCKCCTKKHGCKTCCRCACCGCEELE